MLKKEISSLYFLHIHTAENDVAIKGYVSTLWGYNKALA